MITSRRDAGGYGDARAAGVFAGDGVAGRGRLFAAVFFAGVSSVSFTRGAAPSLATASSAFLAPPPPTRTYSRSSASSSLTISGVTEGPASRRPPHAA